MSDYFDRFGSPMPDDWYDKAKYEKQYSSWHTDRRVGYTVVGEYTVSTVWLGLDHQYQNGPPIIFETKVFGGKWANEMARYSTEEQAMRGHLSVLDRLRADKPPFLYLDEDES